MNDENRVGGASGSNRVIRGGNWNNNAQSCRSANRNNNIGFRLASSPRGPMAAVHERPSRARVVTRAAVPCPIPGTNSPTATRAGHRAGPAIFARVRNVQEDSMRRTAFGFLVVSLALGLLGAATPVAANTTYTNTFTLDLRTATLRVVGMEVTQGVQDIQNSVVLIKGKPTYVRVHVRSSSGTLDVVGELEVSRAGVPVPMGSTRLVKVRETPDRTKKEDSFLFDLPANQVYGELELKFKLGTGYHPPVCAEPAGPTGGADTTGDGDCKVKVRFETSPAIRVAFVPFKWREGGNDHIAGAAEINAAKAELLRTMPLAKIVEFRTFPTADVRYAGVFTAPDSLLDFVLLSTFLKELRLLAGCWWGCTDYYFGILKDPFAGCTGGCQWVVGMAGGTPSFVFAGYNDNARTVSHEVGHCFGRIHTNHNCQDNREPVENGACALGVCACCIWPASCSAHTPADGTIGGEDRDTKDEFLLADTVFGLNELNPLRPKTPDLLSYGSGSWPSKYTYTGIRNYLVSTFGATVGALTPAPLVPTSPVLLVSGILDLEAVTGELLTVKKLDGPAEVSSVSSQWALRVEDGGGATLETFPFEPPVPVEGSVAGFSLLIPWHASATRVVLLHGAAMLDQRQASGNAPTVQLVYPNGGESLGSSGTAQVTWTAGDLDSDTLAFDLQYSRDGGQSWGVLAMNVTGTAYELDLSRLPESAQGRLRVTANDGFHTASDDSDGTFVVAGHAPTARITQPEGVIQMLASASLNLWGEGLDVEDGQLGDAALTWSSSLVGALGGGPAISVDGATLGVGTHTVTLTATDSQGGTGIATLTVTVASTLPPDPVTLSCAPDWLHFSALENQAALTSSQSVAVRNLGDGVLPWTASADQPWIVLGALSGADEGDLDVQVHASGLAVGEHTGTITITAAGAVGSPQEIEVTASVAPFVATAAGAPLVGHIPLTVSFEALATGAVLPLSYLWYFGDSDASSVAQSPTHTYTAAGEYAVTLGITDGSGRTKAAMPLVVTATALSGDANGDGAVNVGDVFYLINYLFAGGPDPVGPGNVNGDGSTNVGDVFYLINYLFAGGPAPV